MNEQIYFEQFVGDDPLEMAGTPLWELFQDITSNMATYNSLYRGGVRTVEQAVGFYIDPKRFSVKMFGSARMNELSNLLRQTGLIE